MSRLSRPAAIATAVLLLSGCATQQQRVQSREDMLAAAGFKLQPANTPERQASLASLAPNTVVRKIDGEKVSYLYADPLVCHCLFVGNQDAYSHYQSAIQQQRIADEQVEASQMADTNGFGWGPWGGYGPWLY